MVEGFLRSRRALATIINRTTEIKDITEMMEKVAKLRKSFEESLKKGTPEEDEKVIDESYLDTYIETLGIGIEELDKTQKYTNKK